MKKINTIVDFIHLLVDSNTIGILSKVSAVIGESEYSILDKAFNKISPAEIRFMELILSTISEEDLVILKKEGITEGVDTCKMNNMHKAILLKSVLEITKKISSYLENIANNAINFLDKNSDSDIVILSERAKFIVNGNSKFSFN